MEIIIVIPLVALCIVLGGYLMMQAQLRLAHHPPKRQKIHYSIHIGIGLALILWGVSVFILFGAFFFDPFAFGIPVDSTVLENLLRYIGGGCTVLICMVPVVIASIVGTYLKF